MRTKIIIAVSFLAGFISCTNDDNKPPEIIESAIPVIIYSLKGSSPHDINAFTEGLLFHEGILYESTGADRDLPQTRSLFGSVDMKTGQITTKAELNKQQYFGEGITFLNGKVYQLTYKTKIGFIYDAKTFKKTGEFSFPSAEGWGMTTDGHSLIMSDGTSHLTYLDPVSFKVMKTINVVDGKNEINNLNELEYINGFIYANVYTTSAIVKIDPVTGKALGRLNLSSLANDAVSKHPGSIEMNGIAYDSATNRIFVTGKLWPLIYEIDFPH